MDNESKTLPLFPLNTVLFPGSQLRLRLFEQRYLDMIKACMKTDEGFVIVLIEDGSEVGDAPKIYSVGNLVEIIDWETLEDGLLGITVRAQSKVKILETHVLHDGLIKGEVTLLEDKPQTDKKTERYDYLVDTLSVLVQHPLLRDNDRDIDYDSATTVSYKLSELLPVSNTEKQLLLEIDSTESRLDHLDKLITRIQSKEQ